MAKTPRLVRYEDQQAKDQSQDVEILKKDVKNAIINGGFDFWQRGTSANPAIHGSFLTDRFAFFKSGSQEVRIDQVQDVASWSKSTNSVKLEITTANASPNSGEYADFNQNIEGVFFRDIKGKDIKLGFDVKSSRAGDYIVTFRDGDLTRGFASKYTIDTANTWQRIYVDIPADTNLTGYPGGTAREFVVTFQIMAVSGSGITVLDQWMSGANIHNYDEANNICDTIGEYIQFSDIMLHDASHGEVDFQTAGRDYAEELRLCQRYYCKAAGHGGISSNNAGLYAGVAELPIEMRELPTIIGFKLYVPNVGTFPRTLTTYSFHGGKDTDSKRCLYMYYWNGNSSEFTYTGSPCHTAFDADAEL